MSLPFERPDSRAFEAKYPGMCENCDSNFEVGTSVMFEGQRVVHADADECVSLPARPDKKPCGKCFLVHAGDCF